MQNIELAHSATRKTIWTMQIFFFQIAHTEMMGTCKCFFGGSKTFVSSCAGNRFQSGQSLLFKTPHRGGKLLSRQSFEFKQQTMGHLAHSKFTVPPPLTHSCAQNWTSPTSINLQMNKRAARGPWLKAEFGSAGSVSACPASHSTCPLLCWTALKI